jgi:hypothetical protein
VIPFLLQEENRTFNLIGGTSQRRRCLPVQTDKTIKVLILYVCSWFVLVDFFDHLLVVSRSLLMVCARLYTVWSQNNLRVTLISSDLSVAPIVHIKRLTERTVLRHDLSCARRVHDPATAFTCPFSLTLIRENRIFNLIGETSQRHVRHSGSTVSLHCRTALPPTSFDDW